MEKEFTITRENINKLNIPSEKNMVIPFSFFDQGHTYIICKIDKKTFAYNHNIESIILPRTIKTIEDQTF